MSKQSRSKAKKQALKFWSAVTLAVFALFSGAVLQINASIHQNSVLDDYRERIAALSSENDELEVKLSQSNSLENFNQYEIMQAGNYEKVDVASVRYIHASDSQLAKN
jgi:hypothetical protein